MSKDKKTISKKDQPISLKDAVQRFIGHSEFAQHVRQNCGEHEVLNNGIGDLNRRLYKVETYLTKYGAPMVAKERVGHIKGVKITAKSKQFKRLMKRNIEKYIEKYLKKYLKYYFREAIDEVITALINGEEGMTENEENQEEDDTCCRCCSIRRIDPDDLPEELKKDIDGVMERLFGNGPYVPKHGDVIAVIDGDYKGFFGEVNSYNEECGKADVTISVVTDEKTDHVNKVLSREQFIVVGSPLTTECKKDDDDEEESNSTCEGPADETAASNDTKDEENVLSEDADTTKSDEQKAEDDEDD